MNGAPHGAGRRIDAPWINVCPLFAQSFIEYGALAADVEGPWQRFKFTISEVSPQTWLVGGIGVLLVLYVFRRR